MRISIAKLRAWINIVGDGIFLGGQFIVFLLALKLDTVTYNLWNVFHLLVWFKVLLMLVSYKLIDWAVEKKMIKCEEEDERDIALMQKAAEKAILLHKTLPLGIFLVCLISFVLNVYFNYDNFDLALISQIMSQGIEEIAYNLFVIFCLGFVGLILFLSFLPSMLQNILFLYYDAKDEEYYYE